VGLAEEGDMADRPEVILGEREVDAFVDCVGFEAHACGCNHGKEAPATVLNSAMQMTRAGGQIGIPGLYVTEDPGAVDDAARQGALSMRFGLGWAKSHSFHTGQCPVMKYHRPLMQAILFDKVRIADAVNVQLISLDEAPQGYADFDGGAAKKFVIDPHGSVAA
jgi:glutathione-independent formaldehyde dehydrogenase